MHQPTGTCMAPVRLDSLLAPWEMLTGANLPTVLICAGDWAWPCICGTCTWEVCCCCCCCCCLRSWKCAGVMAFPGSWTPVAAEETTSGEGRHSHSSRLRELSDVRIPWDTCVTRDRAGVCAGVRLVVTTAEVVTEVTARTP